MEKKRQSEILQLGNTVVEWVSVQAECGIYKPLRQPVQSKPFTDSKKIKIFDWM